MLEGMKEYTSGKLMCLGRHLDRLLKAGDVTEDEDLPAPAGENQSRAPEWIQTKQVSKNWGNKIAAAFEACGEEYGVDKPAPTKKVKDQAKIRPKVLQAKMTKMAFFRKAYEKGLVLGNEFAAANPEWEVGTFASTPVFRSKSIQGDKLVVTWRMEQFWEELEPEVRCKFGFTKRTKFLKPGDRYETSRNETKEMILTTTWNQDASVLIDWNVELVDGPTSEW
jgi:hypothetical protein